MTAKLQCPQCTGKIEHRWESKCEECGARIVYCPSCSRHSLLEWNAVADAPSIAAHCQFCRKAITETAHVFKSELYKHYRYAFKFVNKTHVAYPMYFMGQFPFGGIDSDFGDFVNDFLFESDKNEEWAQWLGTDFGTARAYKVLFHIDDDEQEQCIALSHETGLEVFLIAAGALVGVETAKFVLKRTLETIEKSINAWWKKNREKHWSPERVPEGDLVDHIAVRTPHWEIAIDGRFTQDERDRLITHIGETLLPHETIEEFVSAIDDAQLAAKTVKASRRIIKRLPEKAETSNKTDAGDA